MHDHSSYSSILEAINIGMTINPDNGQVIGSGTPDQMAERQKIVDSLTVVLDNAGFKIEGEGEGLDYMLCIRMIRVNEKDALALNPVVQVIYKDGDSYKAIVDVNRIPTRWLDLIVKTRTALDAWKGGKVKCFCDTWPRGFVRVNEVKS